MIFEIRIVVELLIFAAKQVIKRKQSEVI